MENRNGLIVDAEVLQANGTAERDAALVMLEQLPGTTAGDRGRRQGLRHAGFRGRVPPSAGDAACGAEPRRPRRQRD